MCIVNCQMLYKYIKIVNMDRKTSVNSALEVPNEYIFFSNFCESMGYEMQYISIKKLLSCIEHRCCRSETYSDGLKTKNSIKIVFRTIAWLRLILIIVLKGMKITFWDALGPKCICRFSSFLLDMKLYTI